MRVLAAGPVGRGAGDVGANPPDGDKTKRPGLGPPFSLDGEGNAVGFAEPLPLGKRACVTSDRLFAAPRQ